MKLYESKEIVININLISFEIGLVIHCKYLLTHEESSKSVAFLYTQNVFYSYK